MLNRSRWSNALYVLPALIVYAAFVFVPVLATLAVSFTAWNGTSLPRFVGVENYAGILSDPRFHAALRNNAVLLVFYSVIPIAIGLALSGAISTVRPRERAVFRLLFFLPYVMPMAVLGVIWRWLYNPAFGPIDQVFRAVGLPQFALAWLGDFTWALPSVGMVAAWYFFGFCLAIFMAGIQRIDPSLVEAATLDGASRLQAFRHVTLPALRPEIRVALLLTVIASIKAFDLVFVMTRGGPGTATLVANIYMYENGFQLSRFGYAAAVALIGMALVFLVNGCLHAMLRERS